MATTAPDPPLRLLYVASTPYHVLLALAHAERQGAESALYLLGNFRAAPAYLRALTAAAAAPMTVEGLACAYGDLRAYRQARLQLRGLLRRFSPQAVCVFNDHNDVSQYALGWAALRRRGRICIEDGSSFYTDWIVDARPRRLKQLRRRLTMAWGWTALRVPGTHPLLQQVLVMRPDLVRPELRGRAAPLGLDLLASPAVRAFARDLLGELGCSALPDCPDWLVLPPIKAVLATPRLLAQMAGSGSRGAYKYHPREQREDPAALQAHAGELPRDLPCELLYGHWGRVPARVVGEAGSTVLLTSRLMGGQSRVTGLYQGERPSYADSYRRAGIELLRLDS